jgi:hypothetical protein
MKTFRGLADAHGIEFFKSTEQLSEMEDKEEQHFNFVVKLRAEHNRQRHAVVFQAEVSDKAEGLIQKAIEEGDFVGALDTLKAYATTIQVEEGWEKSWGLIPNPELDPWWRADDNDNNKEEEND